MGALSWSAAALAGTGNGDLTDTNINYVGRWDKSNSATFRSYWNGSYLSTKFTGTTVKVKVAEQTVLTAIIDGVPTTYWNVSGTVNLTSTPLANGTHTLKILAKYENVELPIQGLILDAGATTVKPDALPLVEFVGDSITTGVTTTDVVLSDYAWLTGERLGADHTQVSYPGITLADGYHYSNNTFPGMESLYFKLWQANRCPDVACTGNPAWNFANYTAKLVVVNLGSNDSFNSVPAATFQTRYTNFLQNIRAKYPNADLFALRAFGGFYQAETQAAVNARVSAGDAKVHYIDTTGWLDSSSGSTDFTDGLHPSDTGHVKVSDRLLPILLPYLGVVTRNDTSFSYDNTANWPSGGQNGAYLSDNHWSSVTNAYYQVPFTGTQVKLYGGQAPAHGIAAVSVDGGAETFV
ncbi:MAG TPA: GDSL-type esterase/lipase family protein, partial [Roseateles sp.]